MMAVVVVEAVTVLVWKVVVKVVTLDVKVEVIVDETSAGTTVLVEVRVLVFVVSLQ